MAGFIRDREALTRVMATFGTLIHGGAFEPFGLMVAEAVCFGLALVVPTTGGAAKLTKTA